MANDKIFIKCKHCGEHTTLFKYYPSNYGLFHPDWVDAFAEKHFHCSPHFGKMDLEGDVCFELVVESDPKLHEKIKLRR